MGLLTGSWTARNRRRTTASAPTSAPTSAPVSSGATVATSKVPVGGAVRMNVPGATDPVYVVQPKAGTYCAFSSACTHAGCTVLPPKDGAFVCPCHSSKFDATTGAVLQGPATQPLPRFAVTESNGVLHVSGQG
nr:Rieske (2Fe-2S) protein [Streptacidiphilus rugosus]